MMIWHCHIYLICLSTVVCRCRANILQHFHFLYLILPSQPPLLSTILCQTCILSQTFPLQPVLLFYSMMLLFTLLRTPRPLLAHQSIQARSLVQVLHSARLLTRQTVIKLAMRSWVSTIQVSIISTLCQTARVIFASTTKEWRWWKRLGMSRQGIWRLHGALHPYTLIDQ